MGKSTDKYKGITSSKVLAGLEVEVKTFAEYAIKKDIYGARVITGDALYKIWRDAVAANGLIKVTMLAPTVAKASKDYANMESIFKTFTQGYEEDTFPEFMNTIMLEWSSLSKHLKDTKVWNTDDMVYLDIGVLKYALPKVLMWYESYLKKQSDAAKIKAFKESVKSSGISAVTSLQSVANDIQLEVVNKFEKSSVGYTYLITGLKYAQNGTVNRTYEEDYAEAAKDGDTAKMEMIKVILEKKAIDLDASFKRISILLS